MWICINHLDQAIWLVYNKKWAWHLNLFSMTRVKENKHPCRIWDRKSSGSWVEFHSMIQLHGRQLMLRTPGKSFSRRHFEIFSYLSQKIGVVITVKAYFIGKIRKTKIINMSSSELAQRVVKVKWKRETIIPRHYHLSYGGQITVTKWRNLPIRTQNPHLHNINSHTKFGENLLVFTHVIVWKRKYGPVAGR